MAHTKVLIVDDNAEYAQLLSRAAKRAGLDVRAVTNLGALGSPDTWDFSVAVVDFDLKAVNGIEFTSYLNHFSRPVPVVLVSAIPRHSSPDWPRNIKTFVCKEKGVDTIMAAVKKIAQGD
jgi:CheY-like chemotaxis protein